MELINNKIDAYICINQNIEALELRLLTYRNEELLDKLISNFDLISDIENPNKEDAQKIVAISSCYIDAVMGRLIKQSIKKDITSLLEFTKLIQRKLKKSYKKYTINNMLRLYSFGIVNLKKMGYDIKRIKKEFQ